MPNKAAPAPAPSKRREVPLLDLKAQYRSFKAEVLPAIERVCESQGFILGRETLALEAAVATYCQAAHGIGVSSGTDALLLAMMALDVAAGDEVLTSTFTFFATGGTIARLGARPVFLDIDPVTYNLSPAAVERYIEEHCEAGPEGLRNRSSGARVRALMPVHLYGQCADLVALRAIAARHGLRLIEDAAQAIGSELADGTRAGSVGDVGCFSFFPSKNLGAFGGKPKYFHAEIGGNFRIDEVQSAVLNVKLRYLDGWTAGRQRNAARYAELFRAARLEGAIGLPVAVPGFRHIYNQYVIRAPERDRLRQHLADCGVGTEIYYPLPLHRQACFAYLGGRQGDCPEAERAAAETLALPVFAELGADSLEYVVESIRAFYA